MQPPVSVLGLSVISQIHVSVERETTTILKLVELLLPDEEPAVLPAQELLVDAMSTSFSGMSPVVKGDLCLRKKLCIREGVHGTPVKHRITKYLWLKERKRYLRPLDINAFTHREK